MLKHHDLMRWRIWLLSLALLGCTERNKKFCGGDGVCADPAFPFCDVGGEIAGIPDTCIAVGCTPGEFETGRGDTAITCNGAGGDFDLIPCELGCDDVTGGCKQCAVDTDCQNPTPVCEATTSSCRGCVLDDECASRVCDRDTGECALESSVVYASADGNASVCSLAEPCSLTSAVQGAVAAGGLATVRLLPGMFSEVIDVRSPTGRPIKFVGPGATILPTVSTIPAITVRDGANVEIRGVAIIAAKAIACGTAAGNQPLLALREASVNALENGSVIDTIRCGLELAEIDINLNVNEVVLGIDELSTVRLDRVKMHGNTQHHIFASGTRVNVEITNSLLDNIGIALNTSDTVPPGSQITVASSTVIHRQFSPNFCEVPANARVRVENSILALLDSTADTVRGSCSFSNTILSRQSNPPSGTVVADPQFVDSNARDFHLKSTSPGVDAAVPSIFVLEPTSDLDGVARPQGLQSDIGAYELKP